MRLAILITNTDHSDFAGARPDDAVKFSRFVALARPDWSCTSFDLPRGDALPKLEDFDGFIIGGSPAFLSDDRPWIAPLLEFIRAAHADRVPLLGTCFGHQAIAAALGGRVGRNGEGWGHGLLELQMFQVPPWMKGAPKVRRLYGSHAEQVLDLPDNATVWCASEGCPIAGFFVENSIFTTQHHPEISADFMADLVDHLADYMGAEVTEKARASLIDEADNAAFAEAAAQFFEQAIRA
ncbi:type 1 glutamine amidotransferase [Pseudahrensia aquimaris]|uniref:Type 1 glutamine amidotransferase n=1 Tax=Pseudahrensia aquimaris TaxID=744461 RepID=A0ABW3FC70_9HYPH